MIRIFNYIFRYRSHIIKYFIKHAYNYLIMYLAMHQRRRTFNNVFQFSYALKAQILLSISILHQKIAHLIKYLKG